MNKNRYIARILSAALAFMFVFMLGITACTPAELEEDTCMVAFDMNRPEGIAKENVQNPPAVQYVKKGATAVRPPQDPSIFGYNFLGWFTTKAGATLFDFDNTVINNVEDTTFIYAKWENNIQKFKVTFDLNYAEMPPAASVEVESGDLVQAPANPSRAGNVFLGWFMDKDMMFAWNFATDKPVGDMSLYAGWEAAKSLTFNQNYGANSTQTIMVGNSQNTTQPANPVQTGFVFLGWTLTANGADYFEFGKKLSDNTTLYAKWGADSLTPYTITFNLNYLQAPASFNVIAYQGGTVARPVDPVQSGYFFVGWFTTPDGTVEYTLNTPVTGNLTVYAKWVVSYQFVLDLNYPGSPRSTQNILPGGMIPAKPATNPVRAAVNDKNNPGDNFGFEFVCWSKAADSDVEFTGFGNEMTEDIVLYAQWRHTTVLEAEYMDLKYLVGVGLSGGGAGAGCIESESDVSGNMFPDETPFPKVNASNGFVVTYLYGTGVGFFVEFDVDREAEIKFDFRITVQRFWPTINPDYFSITLDPATIELSGAQQKVTGGSKLYYDQPRPEQFGITKLYEDVRIIEVNGKSTDLYDNAAFGFMLPCADISVYKDAQKNPVKLTKGHHRIAFVTTNSESAISTLSAHAPLVDCIKLTSTAKLTWTPLYENLVAKGRQPDWWL